MEENGDGSENVDNPLVCAACELVVVWARRQLRNNKTAESIHQYLNEVNYWVLRLQLRFSKACVFSLCWSNFCGMRLLFLLSHLLFCWSCCMLQKNSLCDDLIAL